MPRQNSHCRPEDGMMNQVRSFLVLSSLSPRRFIHHSRLASPFHSHLLGMAARSSLRQAFKCEYSMTSRSTLLILSQTAQALNKHFLLTSIFPTLSCWHSTKLMNRDTQHTDIAKAQTTFDAPISHSQPTSRQFLRNSTSLKIGSARKQQHTTSTHLDSSLESARILLRFLSNRQYDPIQNLPG